jgi:2-C-methyl-D-erythritol 2,4-cyclodiphosphate synthase
MRIGQGFDVHRFGPPAEDSAVTLGGVRIPHSRPLLAHSDGDVLLHAVADALLGACALGDIGWHFPPQDPQWRDADSRALLRAVFALVQAKGYRLGNLDCTLIAEKPKMKPHIPAMRATLAADLDAGLEQISIKATTTEGLGFTGRGEGIAAQAICLLLPA